MENLKYRVIYEYEFHRGTSAAETARRINNVYEGATVKENTVRFWFQRFRSGNFDLQNKPRGRPETRVNNEELKVIVEADPSQTTSELAAGFGVSDKTVLIHLEQTMMEKLAIKQPRLVNRSSPLLLQDNARPHTAHMTVAKLEELRLECLRHPPYSPDLAPTDYHFFRNLDNFLRGKKFNSDEAVKTAFKDFVDSRSHNFFSKGIKELPMRWRKCIDSNGTYFD